MTSDLRQSWWSDATKLSLQTLRTLRVTRTHTLTGGLGADVDLSASGAACFRTVISDDKLICLSLAQSDGPLDSPLSPDYKTRVIHRSCSQVFSQRRVRLFILLYLLYESPNKLLVVHPAAHVSEWFTHGKFCWWSVGSRALIIITETTGHSYLLLFPSDGNVFSRTPLAVRVGTLFKRRTSAHTSVQLPNPRWRFNYSLCFCISSSFLFISEGCTNTSVWLAIDGNVATV